MAVGFYEGSSVSNYTNAAGEEYLGLDDNPSMIVDIQIPNLRMESACEGIELDSIIGHVDLDDEQVKMLNEGFFNEMGRNIDWFALKVDTVEGDEVFAGLLIDTGEGYIFNLLGGEQSIPVDARVDVYAE